MRRMIPPEGVVLPAFGRFRPLAVLAFVLAALPGTSFGAEAPSGPVAEAVAGFLDAHCLGCHDAASKKGGLDLEALGPDLRGSSFETWVKVLGLEVDRFASSTGTLRGLEMA